MGGKEEVFEDWGCGRNWKLGRLVVVYLLDMENIFVWFVFWYGFLSDGGWGNVLFLIIGFDFLVLVL